MRRATPWILAAALAAGGPVAAQVPDEFHNLQVLPKDTPKPQLVEIMRSFAMDLGVRCEFCHDGPEGARLDQIDFPSDAKEQKKIAREMLRMVARINGELLPEAVKERGGQVRCYTCHRGVSEPRRIEQLLLAAFDEGGVEAVRTRYAELRADYLGQGSYDFSYAPLNALAEAVAGQRQDPAGAVAVAEFGVELHPGEVWGHVLLGRLRVTAGDRKGGLAALEKAQELAPDNPWIASQVEQLRAPPAAEEEGGGENGG